MRRLIVSCSAAALSLIGGAVGMSAVASATDTTVPSDDASTGHPLVGTWVLTDVEGTFTGAFLSDGVYVHVEDGDAGVGAWEATGPDSAAMMITLVDEEGTVIIRVSITVDGDSLSGEYTIEVAEEGAPTGEFGPVPVTGTRAVVEPMGTPVGPLEDLFGAFDEGTDVSGTEVGGGDAASYCALSAELDAQEGAPTPEQLEQLRGMAPEEISTEVSAIVDGFLEQGPAFFGTEEASELFGPIEAFEAENC